MASVNKAILVGNLGKAPEIKTMPNGERVANLSLATTDAWRDKHSNERRERTEWHRVVIFNENLVRLAEQYLTKGARVYVEGRIETRKWSDRDGTERYVTEIVLRNFGGQIVMLNSPGDGGADRSGRGESRPSGAPAGGRANVPTDDDEIPF